MITRFLFAAFAFVCLTACQALPLTGGANADDYQIELAIVSSEATLFRAVDPAADEQGAPSDFLLRITSVLDVKNQSGRDQEVLTQFGSPYDDLRLRIRDSGGRKIVTTSHTLLVEPLLEPQWTVLPEGESQVRLVVAAPVVHEPVEYPHILASDLTKTIQLEFFGGFPGSELSRAFQSNRVTVEIDDQTAVVPRRPLPAPRDRV